MDERTLAKANAELEARYDIDLRVLEDDREGYWTFYRTSSGTFFASMAKHQIEGLAKAFDQRQARERSWAL